MAREIRLDPLRGPVTKLAYAERYVMVKRELATPYVVPVEIWRQWEKVK